MKREYVTPVLELCAIDVDVITTSDWELPKTEWETDSDTDNDW